MPKEKLVQKWLDCVHEDISAAEVLNNTGHWLYAGFLCHQAIEKALKAYWVDTYGSDPRYTHNHGILVEDCGLSEQLSEEHRRLIDLMVPLYIEARYPEHKAKATRMLNKEASDYILKTTKELILWIEERLPSRRPSDSSGSTSK